MAEILQLSIIEFSTRTLITGTILHSPIHDKKKVTIGLKNAKHIVYSYHTKIFKNKPIAILLRDKTVLTNTDNEGKFSVELNAKSLGKIKILDSILNKEIKCTQKYPVLFSKPNSRLNIVSDIDETIIKSYTKSLSKRIYTTLFKPAHKRKVIDFTKELFNFYKKQNSKFYYVSRSETNLFSLISHFITINQLPKGPLLLTPYLNFKTLLKNKKDPDFKFKTIEKLLSFSKEEQFILIGDDSQRDIEIYTAIANKYGAQISYIFIRQTKKKRSHLQNNSWLILKKTGIKAYYYKKNESFNLDLL